MPGPEERGNQRYYDPDVRIILEHIRGVQSLGKTHATPLTAMECVQSQKQADGLVRELRGIKDRQAAEGLMRIADNLVQTGGLMHGHYLRIFGFYLIATNGGL